MDPVPAPDGRRRRALSVPLAAGFVSVLDAGIVSIAVPSIREDMGASAAEVQWVVSGYALMFGLALVPAGRVGDALGRRPLFAAASVAFVACCALAGSASDPATLIAARLGQGVAAGVLAAQNTAVIVEMFPDDERGRAFGAFGAVTGLAMGLSPVLGGVIMAIAGHGDGWRWVFYANVPVGAMVLLLALRLLPPGDRRKGGYVDVIGAALLGGVVVCVLLPLMGAARLWWLLPIAAAPAAAFADWERRIARRQREPLVDLELLASSPGYVVGVVVGTAYFFGFGGVWLVFSLFFQLGLGYGPLQAGLAVTPFAVGVTGSALVAGRLAGRLGPTLLVVGLAVAFAGLVATVVVLSVAPTVSAWTVAAPLLLAGVGGGCAVPTNTRMTLRRVPVHGAGSAGGALQTGQRLGTAVGAAAVTGAFYAVHGVADITTAAAVGVSVAAGGVGLALVIAAVSRSGGRR